MRSAGGVVDPRRLAWLAFWVSAAILGYEIALMRLLLLASWHHFAFLVISVALLGFGASGTALTLVRPLALRRPDRWLFALALLTAVSMPLATALVCLLPVEARLVPTLLGRQIGAWVLVWTCLLVPFALGASVVGLALMSAERKIAGVYAANLVGSGAGALLAPALMLVMPVEWIPATTAAAALVGAAAPPRRARLARVVAWLVAVVAIALTLRLAPPRVRLDPFKYAAMVARLESQGAATRVARASPRAVVEAWRSDALHDLPFLGVGASPPAITVLVIDGHWAGSVLDARAAEDAEAVEHTLMAAAYRFAQPRPRVALLGEVGGSNVWLAARREAEAIDVVQPIRSVADLLRGPLRDTGGAVLDRPGTRMVIDEPRHFIEHAAARYDVIQLVALESSAAGSGGVAGLAQDHLLTREGMEACLEHLTDDGILFACRGIQTPPRDNVKLLATLADALRRQGVAAPRRHVVVLRDYLAVCTIVRKTPFTAGDRDLIRAVCRERQLTPVWFDGIEASELNRPDALPAPPDGRGDWYHHAAEELLSGDAGAFIDAWAFDIRPPTDDRPYFHDFFRIRSIAALRSAYGDLWLTRTELSFLFVLAAAAFVGVAGVVLILLPLPLAAGLRRPARRTATFAFFAAIGLAYMLLEMTFLSRTTHLVGDPVIAAALTIACFMMLSGAGSLAAQALGPLDVTRTRRLLLTLVVVALIALLAIEPMIDIAGAWPGPARVVTGLALVAPAAFLMGFPMPTALARLDRALPAAVPWAWGINGFASVLATPLAVVIAMSAGLRASGFAAVALYACAAWLYAALPRQHTAQAR